MTRAVRFGRNLAAVSALLYAGGLTLGAVLFERYIARQP